MSGILDYANAVVEMLSAYGAKIEFAPDFDVRDLKEIRVAVLPAGRKTKFETRGSKRKEHLLNVAVIQKWNGRDIEDLIAKAEEIGDLLHGKRILNGICMNVEWNPLYAVDELREKGIFISVLNVVFEEFVS